MKNIILCVFFVLTACAPQKIIVPDATPVNNASYQQIIELPKQTKQQIFQKSKQWMATTFTSSSNVFQYESIEEGRIIGNGTAQLLSTVHSTGGLTGAMTMSVPYRAGFVMIEDIKDNKARITFEKIYVQLTHNVNVSANLNQPGVFATSIDRIPDTKSNSITKENAYDGITQDGWNQLKPKLVELTESLKNYLNSTDVDNW